MRTTKSQTRNGLKRSPQRRGAALLIAILVGLVTACGPAETVDEETGDVRGDEMGMVADAEIPAVNAASIPDTLVDAAFAGMGEESEVEGRLLVLWRSAEKPLELVLKAEGLQAGDHAWDIHGGSCTAGGPVALALSETADDEGVVGPLLVDQTRMVDITVEVPELAGMVPSDGRYTLHVHEGAGIVHSPEAPEPRTVACARL